jgi:hypothetical protein
MPVYHVLLGLLTLACVATIVGSSADEHGSMSPLGAAAPPAPISPAPVTVVSLDQGWDDQTREQFWFTTQGSQILPYAYFLALEQASSTEPFASPANMDLYRYLPSPPSALNPDGLPIGFAKHTDPDSGEAFLGFTCAACHTTRIDYNGTGLLIDGAGTLADFQSMFGDLVAALNATAQDNDKFARFADRVLGPDHSQTQADTLLNDLVATTLGLAERRTLNMPPSPPGFARLDAFGNIFNEVMAVSLGVAANAAPPNAPVSYPFLWTTAQLDLVQWNGSAPNAGIGPLVRNIGEVIGVFGHLQIEVGDHVIFGYPSTIDVSNLGSLENWVADLLSPQWPNQYLPPIDAVQAANGKLLYDTYCSSCHAVIPRTAEQEVQVMMVPVGQVQTDPTMAVNAATRMGQTGPLEGTHKYIVPIGDTFGAIASAGDFVTNSVVGVLLNHPFEGVVAAIEEYRRVKEAPSFDPESYKARPLNGIWATAPYLHNGSVPNLAQLLLPPSQRMQQFAVGSREYDPINVGFVTAPSPGSYLYDTTMPGNSNAGHDYGTAELTDTQRLELLEYLKTL